MAFYSLEYTFCPLAKQTEINAHRHPAPPSEVRPFPGKAVVHRDKEGAFFPSSELQDREGLKPMKKKMRGDKEADLT
ncbi:hypothetical protein QTO34_000780 [Cnephaeus nilssonii]|uniref:Uncharacterized protein n=1 Tax=Cnephaeus nilssonii TaxID=3371016 RepID=A0AA40LUZ3_CNENI|nr:hypothetical protein QTO34_000780 [Eptesicus nilssonii]